VSILLVNQHTVPIFSDIANAFAAAGEKTILFTGHVEKGGKELSPAISRIESIKYNRRSSSSRLLTWILFSLHYFFFLLFCKKPSRILVVTNPPLAPMITALVARLRKFQFSILVYDLYPEALAMSGLLSERNFIYRSWMRLNPWVYKQASGIFTLSESMRQAVSKYAQRQSIKVISNWADLAYIKPVSKVNNPFIKTHSLENKIVVLYAGNMGLTHDLESLIGAASLFKNDHRVIFVLIGEGGKKDSLEKIAKTESLANVLFLPYQNSNDFPYAMAAADIGVVTLGVGAEGISVPSKTYVNLAAGVCLFAIAPKASELSRLVEEHAAGITCEPGSATRVHEGLLKLISDPEAMRVYSSNALKASRLFSAENAKLYVNEVLT
jgi:glycosyltransferase involved in cell wall biosynthesis